MQTKLFVGFLTLDMRNDKVAVTKRLPKLNPYQIAVRYSILVNSPVVEMPTVEGTVMLPSSIVAAVETALVQEEDAHAD